MLPPTRVNWPLSSVPSKRALRLRRQILDLVDEQGAGAGALEHAGRDLPAGLGAEQHLLGAVAAQRARDQRDERPRGARAGVVDEAREGFAAGAGLADQQHG